MSFFQKRILQKVFVLHVLLDILPFPILHIYRILHVKTSMSVLEVDRRLHKKLAETCFKLSCEIFMPDGALTLWFFLYIGLMSECSLCFCL